VKREVFASREVIVSAGAFNTPQLLKLSGVGPAEELKKFNIDIIVDLQVSARTCRIVTKSE
jgi:choline dehydrogenase